MRRIVAVTVACAMLAGCAGTHGLLPDNDEDAPVFLCSEKSVARDRIAATDVRDLLLELSGVTAPAAR